MHYNFHEANQKQHEKYGKHYTANGEMMEFAMFKISLSIGFCLNTKPGRDDTTHKR